MAQSQRHLRSVDEDFGELGMLYPEKNKNEMGKLNSEQRKAVEKSNAEINTFYEENKVKN